MTEQTKYGLWYDKYYKILLVIPIILVIICLVYIMIFYQSHGDFLIKDSSLSGGTTITLMGEVPDGFEASLKAKFSDVNLRKLTDLRTGETISYVIETSLMPEEIKPGIEEILGSKLTEENSSIEFTGASLSKSFYKQLIVALLISFILMSIVISILFRTFVPSIAVIFAAFSDIVLPLALIDFLGISLSAAGIAAFLMILGYSVDDNILLTTRALKRESGTLNQRLYGAFKTGSFMTLAGLAAVLPAFLIGSGLPESFRQIFFILALGLCADLINTWLTNAGIIKWYCEKKGVQ